jgi:hypothetical protein
MYTSKWCNENLNACPMKWDGFRDEFVELLEARDWENFKEEVADVMYSGLCALHTSTGISLPMIGAKDTIKKIEKRLIVWEEIFTNAGFKFKIKYLKGGSNYKKLHKVEAALNLAIKEQM